MAAGLKASVVYLPSTSDNNFLRSAAEEIERLRTESELKGHSMLASLLAIAKGEAEDGIKTHVMDMRVQKTVQDHDDGAAKLARRFACATRVD